MEINEIKKEVYKQKPLAELVLPITADGLRYRSIVLNDQNKPVHIYFCVPFKDITAPSTFKRSEEAQLLLRWLQND